MKAKTQEELWLEIRDGLWKHDEKVIKRLNKIDHQNEVKKRLNLKEKL